MKRYLYRVELLTEPAEGVHVPRLVYMSRSAATYRAGYLREHGVESVIQRSDPITWPNDGVAQ